MTYAAARGWPRAWVLALREIEDLCHDPEVHRSDLGFGDAEYKRRYAEGFCDEATLRLFAPTARALLCNAARGAVARTDRVRATRLRTAAASAPTRP